MMTIERYVSIGVAAALVIALAFVWFLLSARISDREATIAALKIELTNQEFLVASFEAAQAHMEAGKQRAIAEKAKAVAQLKSSEQTHAATIDELKKIKVGPNECENLKSIIDTATNGLRVQ